MLEAGGQDDVTAGTRMTKEDRCLCAWRRWLRAASTFDDVGDKIRAQRDLRHIRRYTHGYEVVINRSGRKVVYRHFRGFSQQSLEGAMRFRDEIVGSVAPERANSVPAHVLEALGLSRPVIGVYRLPQWSVYRVEYRDGEGNRKQRQFYFRQISETMAYAAALAFRKDLLKRSNIARCQIPYLRAVNRAADQPPGCDHSPVQE